MDVAVDNTGFSLKTSSKWFDIRIKRKSTKKDYIKLHIVIDVDTEIKEHKRVVKAEKLAIKVAAYNIKRVLYMFFNKI